MISYGSTYFWIHGHLRIKLSALFERTFIQIFIQYTMHSTVRRTSHSLVNMMNTEDEDQPRAFTLLDSPTNFASKTTNAQRSTQASSSVHFVLDQIERNIVSTTTNKLKKEDRLMVKLKKISMNILQIILILVRALICLVNTNLDFLQHIC